MLCGTHSIPTMSYFDRCPTGLHTQETGAALLYASCMVHTIPCVVTQKTGNSDSIIRSVLYTQSPELMLRQLPKHTADVLPKIKLYVFSVMHRTDSGTTVLYCTVMYFLTLLSSTGKPPAAHPCDTDCTGYRVYPTSTVQYSTFSPFLLEVEGHQRHPHVGVRHNLKDARLAQGLAQPVCHRSAVFQDLGVALLATQ